jgi:hypothetical protein
MKLEELVENRNAYKYPAVGLSGSLEAWTKEDFTSTLQMDRHHHQLLTSLDDASTVFGYLSAVFWGHFSGRDGTDNFGRADSRAKLARKAIQGGRAGGVGRASDTIREARNLLESDQCGNALRLLWKLPQLGPAFASKVCAFLAPGKCGVVDSVIASSHPDFAFRTNPKGYVKRLTENAHSSDKYCSFLRGKAEELNEKGNEFRWKDRDGTLQPWQAVDVERALYEAR